MLKKKIMILGGGENQLPFIEEAVSSGFEVVLCDYLPNCPGRKQAHKHFLVSTYDKENLLEIARHEDVDGIVTNSEPVLHIVSQLTNELHLPSVPVDVMELFLNKYLMRKKLDSEGVSNIRYQYCHNAPEAVSFFESLKNKKIIMKPIQSSASRGVFSVSSGEEIYNFFSESNKNNRRGEGVLVEEYIDGTEFTVDGICINGIHYSLAISKKNHYKYNENVANELLFSYYDKEFDYDELRMLNDRIVSLSGLTFGMTHAEYKFCNNEFKLIEICARGGGSFIATKLVPELTGINTTKLLLKCAIGETTEREIVLSQKNKQRVGVLKFFSTPQDKSGIVNCIEGEELLKNRNILRYHLNFKTGDFIKPANNDADRIGYYMAVCDDLSSIRQLMNSIDKNFMIKFGENTYAN